MVNKKMKIETIADAKNSLKFFVDILQRESLDIENPENIKEVFLEKIKESGMKN